MVLVVSPGEEGELELLRSMSALVLPGDLLWGLPMEEMLSESKEKSKDCILIHFTVNILTFPALSSDRDLPPGHLEPPELLLQAGHVLSPGEGDQEGRQLHVEVVGGAGVVLPGRAGGRW